MSFSGVNGIEISQKYEAIKHPLQLYSSIPSLFILWGFSVIHTKHWRITLDGAAVPVTLSSKTLTPKPQTRKLRQTAKYLNPAVIIHIQPYFPGAGRTDGWQGMALKGHRSLQVRWELNHQPSRWKEELPSGGGGIVGHLLAPAGRPKQRDHLAYFLPEICIHSFYFLYVLLL